VNRLRLSAAALCAAFVVSASLDARADAVSSAQGDLDEIGREIPGVRTSVEHARAEVHQSAEQRLANGELLYRLNDFPHAIVVLNEILLEYKDTPSYPDALWLLGETYYASHDYLAANTAYKEIVSHGVELRYQTYFGKALARMVDVSIRVNAPPSDLASIFEKFNLVPPAQVDAALLYAKGKAYFRTKAYNEATAAFSQVGPNTAYTHQARYYQGLTALKVAQGTGGDASSKGATSAGYKQAIEAFRAVTVLPPDTAEHRHVVDLAWMAIARLFYEMEQYGRASEAYSKIGRDSPEFDTMLFELGWVYVRMGDVERAERALEVLMVSDPDSEFIGDGTLLRADLLLRAGAFDRALELYKGVLAQYDPMRAKVDAFLDSTKDVAIYYDRLAQQQADLLDQNDQLPPIALKWAREEGDGPLAFAVIDSVNQCKGLIKQSNDLVDKLSAVIAATNSARVRAFPELRNAEEQALTLLNRIARDRLAIARQLDGEEPGDVGGDMGQARQERRSLMQAIGELPASADDFAQREKEGLDRWNKVSQQLSYTTIQIDSLQATVNGLRRMMAEAPQQGVARDPAKVAQNQADIDLTEKELKNFREVAAELRRELEIGRAQIGMGDQRYQDDFTNRSKFIAALEREVQLASGGAAGSGAARFAGQVAPLLASARQYESQLSGLLGTVQAQVSAKAGVMQQQIEEQRTLLAGYQAQLSALDGEAHDLVGQVAKVNFEEVRKRLRGIVLRADVGVTEQAWEVREEELDRVQSLLSERARQEQLLDEELKEVRDDGVEPGQQAAPPKQ
jgi:tetratricopeptide (TPR) repeat protein